MCEPRKSEPNVVPITRDNVVDYLAAVALNVIAHPAPARDDVHYAQALAAHVLAVGFLKDALRQLGKTL